MRLYFRLRDHIEHLKHTSTVKSVREGLKRLDELDKMKTRSLEEDVEKQFLLLSLANPKMIQKFERLLNKLDENGCPWCHRQLGKPPFVNRPGVTANQCEEWMVCGYCAAYVIRQNGKLRLPSMAEKKDMSSMKLVRLGHEAIKEKLARDAEANLRAEMKRAEAEKTIVKMMTNTMDRSPMRVNSEVPRDRQFPPRSSEWKSSAAQTL